MYENQPTSPLQYLSTQQKFQYMQASSWGRARVYRAVEGGDRQPRFDSYCACINLQVLCFIGREREREREMLQGYSLVPEFCFSAQIIWPRNYMYFVFIVLNLYLYMVLKLCSEINEECSSISSYYDRL
jgi:hypothetical protein